MIKDNNNIYEDIKQHEQIITTMQKKKMLMPIIIYNIFNNYRGNSDYLEELKNRISDERDYFDLINLLNNIPYNYSLMIKDIFNSTPISISSPYYTKMLVDIDNTTIENSAVARVQYQDRYIIPGIRSILKYFSNGKTTVDFISARPKIVERTSINMVNKLLSNDLRFSFLTGDIKALVKYIDGKITLSKTKLNNSYYHMAIKKYQNYLELKQIYPHCRFIFMGDDTQGDYYFAKMLVDNNQLNFGIIRQIADTIIQDDIKYHPRIFFHTSYFELIYKLILHGLINKEQIKQLLSSEVLYHYKWFNYIDKSQVAKDQYYYNIIMAL